MRQMRQAAGGRRQADRAVQCARDCSGRPPCLAVAGRTADALAQFLQRLAHRCATRVEFLDDHAIVDGGA